MWKKFRTRHQAQEYLRLRRQQRTVPQVVEQLTVVSPPQAVSLSRNSTLPAQPIQSELPKTPEVDQQLPRNDSEYYAVYLGRSWGICSSLKAVQDLVRGGRQAQVSGFATFDQAEEFMARLSMMVDPQGEINDDGSWTCSAYRRGMVLDVLPDPEKADTLVAFCDGSAIRNGEYDCHVAYASIFPHKREWDIVEVVKGPYATSNRAEYLAALMALKKVNLEDPDQEKMLYIYTDSELW